MNSKNSKSKNPSKKKVETPSTETESFLLAMRKAQAEEMAAKKEPDFSLEQELHDIKLILSEEEKEVGSEQTAPVAAQEVLPVEEKQKAPVTAAKKTGSKPSAAKTKTPAKTTPKKAPSKEEEKKEPAPKVRKPIQKTPSLEALLEKKEPIAEEKQADFFEKLPKQTKEEPQENKVVDNLQKLREQIFAQKKLERELMEKEALKAQQKDKSLMNKLNALERLVQNDDVEEVGDVLEIEKQNQRLTQQLEEANQRIQELQEEFSKMQEQAPDLAPAVSPEITEKEMETNQKIADLEVMVAKQKEEHRTSLDQVKADYKKQIVKLQKELEALQAKKEAKPSSDQNKEFEKELKEKEKEYKKQVQDKEKEFAQKEKELLKQIADKDKALEKADLDKQKEVAKEIDKEKAALLKDSMAKEKAWEKEKNALLAKQDKALASAKKAHEKKLEQALVKADQKLEKKQAEANEKLKAVREEVKAREKEAWEKEKAALTAAQEKELAALQKDFDQKQDKARLAFDQEKAEWNQQMKTAKLNLLDSEAKALEQEKFRQDLLASEQLKQEQLQAEWEKDFALKVQQYEEQKNRDKDLIAELNNQLTAKDEAIAQAKVDFANQVKQLQKEMEASNINYDTKIHALQDQLAANNRVIDSQKHEIDKLNEIHETLKQSMTEERNNHYEIEQKLFKDLDIRNQEVNQLKADIDKIVKEANANKLDSQINAIATLVNELGSKSKELYQQPTANQINPMAYNPYFQKEQFQLFKYEYEQELKKQKEEEEEKKNRVEEQNNLEVKLSNLENKIQELASIFSEKEKSDAMKTNQEQIIRTISTDLEKFKQELKADLDQKLVSKEQSKELSHGMQAIVDRYTKDKDILAYQFNNEINKLEVDKKFESDPVVLAKMDEKIEFVRKRYRQLALNRDQEFQKEVSLFYGYHPEEAPAPDAPHFEEEVEKEMASPAEQEDIIQEQLEMLEEVPPVGEAPEDFIPEETTEEIETPLPAEQMEPEKEAVEWTEEPALVAEEQQEPAKAEPIRREQPLPSHFVGKIDQEYLNKSNNIKRMKKMLESKKTELTLQYEKDEADNIALQKDCIQKIDVINEKISVLESTHRTKKSFLSPADRQFENDKTKLYLELESRKEQLHRLQAEDKRKMDARYQSAMNNIQEQMKALELEEQELKEEYVLKQQKVQSKIIREEELSAKLQEEQTRIIESQEAIKLRKLEETTPPEEPENIQKAEEVLPEEALPEEKPQSEPVKEKVVEISPKEQELRALYEKYALVEKRLVDDFPAVREFKSNKFEILAYEKEIQKQNQLVDHYKDQERQSETEQEARNWDWKGKDIKIKQDNIKVRLQYLKKQQDQLIKDARVSDYQKLTEKLDMMTVLLKQYAQKRGQA